MAVNYSRIKSLLQGVRGRGTSVCSETQRQFHHMHLDRIFCTSPIIKEPSNAGKQAKESKQKLISQFSP